MPEDDAQDNGSPQPPPEAVPAKQPGGETASIPEAVGAAAGVVAVATPTFEQRAILAEARLTEVLGAYRKLRTDHEGFRDRATRNAERRFTQQHERLLLRFIEVLDNFDRALEAAEQTYADEPLVQGLILVRSQLLQILQGEGLERVPVLGLPFDPHVSEAVLTRPVEDPDQHNLVVAEMLRGYRLNGKLARASRVAVGQHGTDEARTADTEGDQKEPRAEGGAEPGAEPAAEATAEREAEVSGVAAAANLDVAPNGATDEETTLDEIIARAEAQQALFPSGFESSGKQGQDEDPE